MICFVVMGILFNHESPIRGIEFVTRKISDGVAQIKCGKKEFISLGNINSMRDWGFAGDYVEAIWLMMQEDKSSDYVIATKEQYSIKDFLKLAFSEVGIYDWKNYVKISKNFKRPIDVKSLCGDYAKAKTNLGWSPKTSFKKLVQLMVREDLKRHKNNNIQFIKNIKNNKKLDVLKVSKKRISA